MSNKKKRKINKQLNKQGISGTVEAAGMLFIFVLLVGLIIQIMMLSTAQNVVISTAAEGVRAGSRVGPALSHTVAKQTVNNYGSGLLSNWNKNATVNISGGGGVGKELKVTVSYKVPSIAILFPSQTVSGSGSQVIEEMQ
ncbi:pilus assembly protein [Clostridium botulinum]|uniref:Pilus assembly protein n=1 Tax=Clostridium botulinum TaxID=1491 RepID=A0A6M0SXC3_CLOBO|nr:pilus assembly protein [Clostridium botulinum]NFI74278.1 pilus assembly protein [Clostridium sporogenes]NFP62186.1 pilus assembly protein [Clostridium sporogenes]NFU95662.1 pilus assembly protein [Clostridium sporogenes]NFV68688.1 pilus assembly protein [Clostridium botulinum]